MIRDHERKPGDVPPYALRNDRPDDENLHELASNLQAGYRETLVVLLGAGASVGATAGGEKLPTAVALRALHMRGPIAKRLSKGSYAHRLATGFRQGE